MRTAKLISEARRAARASDWQRTAEAYRAALALTPDNGRAWIQYGHSLKELGQKAEAEAAYSQAVIVAPRLGEAHFQLGIFRKDLGRAQEAAAALLTALALNPELETAREILMTQGYSDGALETEMFVKLLGLGRPPRAAPGLARWFFQRHLVSRARSAARRGDWQSAAAVYRRADAIIPNDPVILMQLAHALKGLGANAEASTAYRLAIAADPTWAEGHLQIGLLHRDLGRKALALSSFLISWRLQPGKEAVAEILEGEGYARKDLAALALEAWGGAASGHPVHLARPTEIASSKPISRPLSPMKPAYLAPTAMAIWSAWSEPQAAERR